MSVPAFGTSEDVAITTDINGRHMGFLRGIVKMLAASIAGTNPLAVSQPVVRTSTTALISSGGSLSAAVDLGTSTLARIAIPAAWTTANITFQTSADNSTFNDLYDNVGTEYTVTVGGVSRAIIIPIADFLGVRYLKIRSGTTGTPVNQGADRTLTLVLV